MPQHQHCPHAKGHGDRNLKYHEVYMRMDIIARTQKTRVNNAHVGEATKCHQNCRAINQLSCHRRQPTPILQSEEILVGIWKENGNFRKYMIHDTCTSDRKGNRTSAACATTLRSFVKNIPRDTVVVGGVGTSMKKNWMLCSGVGGVYNVRKQFGRETLRRACVVYARGATAG
jgi:hypothetical protein